MRFTPGKLLFCVLLVACGVSSNHPNPPEAYESQSDAVTSCPGGSTVPGLDVSVYQGNINWSQVHGAGYGWAYAKATEDTGYQDPTFPGNWSGMKAAGVIRGAYHFFRPGNGKGQADYYVDYVNAQGGFAPGDLPPMLDWEVSGISTADGQAFIDEVKARTGLQTVIYTAPGLWNSYGLGNFGSNPLWVANWWCTPSGPCTSVGSFCPSLPSGWNSWVFWQWSDGGNTSGNTQVPGVPATVDVDMFNGSLAQLQAFANTPMGPGPIAQQSGNDAITLVNWPDQHMELFAKTPGGDETHLWTSGSNDSWNGPATLDSGAECGSAASFWGGQWVYPELFSPLSNHGSGHLWWTSGVGWNTYKAYGGTDLSRFSTAVGNDGRTSVFALGTDGAIWTNYWDTTKVDWSGWNSLGAKGFVTGAGTVTWGNGTIEIFATDGSGNVWHSWTDHSGTAGWNGWAQLGTPVPMASRPVPVRWSDGQAGHAEVYVRGSDGQLYDCEFSYANGWPGFSVIGAGTQIIGEPSAIMYPGNAGPEVFARDTFGHVMHLWKNASGYTSFYNLFSQVAASDPFGWIRGDGSAEVFAVDTSGNLVRTLHDPANGWQNWSSIGSGFDPCAAPLPQPEMDAGMPPAMDAGPIMVVDSGTPEVDSGTPEVDAGSDAGVDDAGTEVDAGSDDAGTDIDSGIPTDMDASAEIDAGTELDAGIPADMDAGASDQDAGSADAGHPAPRGTGGCGCGGGGSDVVSLLPLLLGAWRLRSRRRMV